MSQKAAMRMRRRFEIKFRDVARIGRPVYPRSVSSDKAARRMRAVVEKQQLMRSRKSKKG